MIQLLLQVNASDISMRLWNTCSWQLQCQALVTHPATIALHQQGYIH
jgi:hypothetical protein